MVKIIFLVVTFKISSQQLSYVQHSIINSVLCTTRHDWLYNWKFVQNLVTPFTHCVPPHPISGNHQSVLSGCELGCFVSFNIPHVSEIIHYLSSPSDLLHLAYCPQVLSMVPQMAGFHFSWKESESHSVVSNSLLPHGLYSPWNSPGQNTRVGSLSLLQGIFPTQGLNPGLPHYSRTLYQLSHQGSPRILEWVAYPFSGGPSWSRNWIRVLINHTPV